MEFRIEMSLLALRDAETTYVHFKKESEGFADEWFRGLVQATNSLKSFPNRCPIAPEARHFFIEIRQMLYGKGKNQHRILFGVSTDEKAGKGVVTIYRIRNSSQTYLRDLEILGEKDEE